MNETEIKLSCDVTCQNHAFDIIEKNVTLPFICYIRPNII